MLTCDNAGVEMVVHPLVLTLACDAGIQRPFYTLSDVYWIVATRHETILTVLDNIHLSAIACGDGNTPACHALDQCVAKRLVARGGKHQLCVRIDVGQVVNISQIGVGCR